MRPLAIWAIEDARERRRPRSATSAPIDPA
jgi:hypothetical protein